MGLDPGPGQLIVLGPKSGKSVCAEYPGQVRPAVLPCRQGETWAILSVQVPCELYVSRAVGWAPQPVVCSAEAPWSGRLNTVFSNK